MKLAFGKRFGSRFVASVQLWARMKAGWALGRTWAGVAFYRLACLGLLVEAGVTES